MKQYVSDPDNVTSEILDNFYDNGVEHHFYLVRYLKSMNISLGTAFRGYIAHFAQRLSGEYFDFLRWYRQFNCNYIKIRS